MGSWGHRALEDDTARDWIDAFGDSPTLDQIESALAAVLDADFIDDLIAPRAMAAAEVVAALNRNPAPELPGAVVGWSASQPQPAVHLLDLARRAVDQVFRESELRDIWEDAENLDKWDKAVKELLGRLSG